MGNFIVEKRDQVAWLTINRPEAMNSLNQAADIELYAILDELGDDTDLRAVVVRGAGGRAFCAGADLKERQSMNAREKFIQARHMGRVFDKIEEIPIPVIAAIRGYCLGGGFKLALACDFRIATPASTFHFPEMTLGAFPGSGGPVRLCRLIPTQVAKEILMLAPKITAAQALECGILRAVVDDDGLEAEAETMCDQLKRCTRVGVAGVKTIINSIQNHDMGNSHILSNSLRESLEGSAEYVKRIEEHFANKGK
jgi:enoyl-CoA hydratase/carnithine racemase